MPHKKKWEEVHKSSDSCFRVKKPGSEKVKRLTGYEVKRTTKAPVEETLRLENSYGTIAFGANKKKEMTVVISEKRRHNQQGISSVEKRLKESSHTRETGSDSLVLNNSGGEKSGALAFKYQPGTAEDKILDGMKNYVKSHKQETMNQMLPFLVREPETEKIEGLKEASNELRSHGMLKEARRLEKEKCEYQTVADEKRNREKQLNQNLIMAIKEMEKKKIRRTDLELVFNNLQIKPEALLAVPEIQEPGPDEKNSKKKSLDDSIVYQTVEKPPV